MNKRRGQNPDRKAYMKVYRIEHAEQIKAGRKAYKKKKDPSKCHNCGKTNDRLPHLLCSICNPKVQEQQRRKHGRLKLAVITHYGGVCICCRESHIGFLSIDHINGGGTQHRVRIGGHLYEWLIKNNYPEGFQVLCLNCNFAKHLYGRCPHQDSN